RLRRPRSYAISVPPCEPDAKKSPPRGRACFAGSRRSAQSAPELTATREAKGGEADAEQRERGGFRDGGARVVAMNRERHWVRREEPGVSVAWASGRNTDRGIRRVVVSLRPDLG